MNIVKRYICYLLIFTFLIYTHLPITLIKSEVNQNNSFNILIINSYNLKSNWEQLIYEGFKNKLSSYDNLNIDIEFLDSKKQNTVEYNNKFIELLNTKYANSKIDAVVTVDDEAFLLIKNYISNPNSIFYQTPMIFIGVNSSFSLTTFEKKYITGVIEMEDNLRLLNLISDIDDTVENIVVLLDNAIFSNVVKNNIISIKNLIKRNINISFIQGDYIEDIIHELSLIETKNTTILLVGDYKYKDEGKQLNLNSTLKLIQKTNSSPIFSKILPYIYAGAIGGVVDSGEYHGQVAGEFIIKLINGIKIDELELINNSLDLNIFNYDAITYYKINPLKLPKDKIVINKGPFDFLLPPTLKILIWILILLTISTVSITIILHIRKIKKDKLQKIYFDKALEQEKFKNDFITRMSHEFKTPLNIILSTTHLLQIKCKTAQLDNNYLLSKLISITQNSNRLLKLINNIMDITKIESGFVTVNFLFANIVEVIEDTVMSTLDYAETKGISIIFDTEDEEIMTSFDKTIIERCILNVISNAIKYTQSDGTILVLVKKVVSDVIIEISDSGIGIPPDQLINIFNRFHQVDTSFTRVGEGSGLGLFIVKELLTLHNGSISVKSVLNEGSTFTLSIPIKKRDASNTPNQFVDYDLSSLVKLEFSDLEDKE